MTTADREDFFLSGLGLTLELVVITVFAFVLPPVLALQLHHRREARAVAQVQEVAVALGQGAGAHLAADPQLREIGVLNGPGDVVTDALDRTWITARAASLEPYVNLPAEGLTPDPWLRALQVNIGAARAGGRLWVLSAGANGIIDTPFVSTGNAVPGGDDIAVPLP